RKKKQQIPHIPELKALGINCICTEAEFVSSDGAVTSIPLIADPSTPSTITNILGEACMNAPVRLSAEEEESELQDEEAERYSSHDEQEETYAEVENALNQAATEQKG